MTQLTKLLIIDDSKISLDALTSQLKASFEILPISSSEEGLAQAEIWQPHVILTDVEMPGRNGYEICDEIKRNPKTQHIPVLFFSSNDSLRERMLGYEMGGDDYLKKGSDVKELTVKLQLAAQRAKHSQELKQNVASAQTTALEAMSTSFELGKAVRYIEQSYTASTFNDLGGLLTQFSNDIKLSVVVMFVSRTGFQFYSTGGKGVAPIEAQLMERLHTGDRFIDFGCRTLVNYPQVSILVKNMPLEDRERYGRIKDTLPFVMGATDAKVRMIDAEKALSDQCGELTSAIDAVQLTLEDIKQKYNFTMLGVNSIMSELRVTIQCDIQGLDMTLDYENRILDLIESSNRKLDIFLQENSSTECALTNIVALLKKLNHEQNRIIEDTLSNTNISDEGVMGDVELF